MSTNNDVYQVLTIPNEASEVLAPATKTVADLGKGKWAIFNADDNKPIDITPTGGTPVGPIPLVMPARWYFAYRGGDNGTTTPVIGEPDMLYKSAGTHIQSRYCKSYTGSLAKAPTAQTIELTNPVIQSGPDATNYDYGLRLDLRGNTEVYQRYGANQATKFFMANTRCVGDETAVTGQEADIEAAAQWAAQISYDTDKFLGVLVDVTGTGGTDTIKYDLDTTTNVFGWTIDGAATTEALALAAIRAGATLDTFEIYIYPLSSLYKFCNVNPKYFKQREIRAIPSLIGGNCKWGDFTETQAMTYEIGRGYDVKELEYVAGGWNGKPGPYRQSILHGLPFMDFEYLALKDHYYNVHTFQYDQFSVGGWLEYLNNLSTYIAVDLGASVPANPATADLAAPDLKIIADALQVQQLIV